MNKSIKNFSQDNQSQGCDLNPKTSRIGNNCAIHSTIIEDRMGRAYSMYRKKMHTAFCLGNLKDVWMTYTEMGDNFRINLKRGYDGIDWIYLAQEWGKRGGGGVHSNETIGSIRSGEFIE
jgi:hypothetical protein